MLLPGVHRILVLFEMFLKLTLPTTGGKSQKIIIIYVELSLGMQNYPTFANHET